MKFIAICCLVGLLPAFAKASSPKQFKETIESAQAWCPDLDCDTSPAILSKHFINPKDLPKELSTQLRIAAQELSQAWGDSILEGDYQSENITHLNSVQLVFINQKPAGYRITYWQRAWDLTTCPKIKIHASNDPSNCLEGIIIESAFIDVSMIEQFVDHTSTSKFLANQQTRP